MKHALVMDETGTFLAYIPCTNLPQIGVTLCLPQVRGKVKDIQYHYTEPLVRDGTNALELRSIEVFLEDTD